MSTCVAFGKGDFSSDSRSRPSFHFRDVGRIHHVADRITILLRFWTRVLEQAKLGTRGGNSVKSRMKLRWYQLIVPAWRDVLVIEALAFASAMRFPLRPPAAGVVDGYAASHHQCSLLCSSGPMFWMRNRRNTGGAFYDHGRRDIASGRSKFLSHYFADAFSFLVQEYFQTAVTGVKKAELVYGPGGSSRGIANVVFHASDGASKAYQKLNGLLIDNRPIRVSKKEWCSVSGLLLTNSQVEVVVTGELVPAPPTLSQRVSQPKATPKSAATDKASGKGAKPASGARGGAAGKRGRAGRPKNARPTKKTADELDAEMADYFDSAKSGGDANAAAATNGGDAAMEDEVL